MKKSFKKLLVMLIILASISISMLISKTEAATLGMSYEKSNNATQKNSENTEVKAGEEIIVKISIVDDDGNSPKVMSIYGNFEFDNNALELIKSENNENSAQIDLGEGWAIGNLNMEDSKFLIYTSDRERNNNVFSVKFKVKEDCKVDNTTIVIKDIILYNSSQKAIDDNFENVNLEIKIDKKDDSIMSIGTVGLIIVVFLIILIIFIIAFKKKSKKKDLSKTVENELKDTTTMEKEDNINSAKNKKNEIKKDAKENNSDKEVKEKVGNKKVAKSKDDKDVDKTKKNKDEKKSNKEDKDNKELKKKDNIKEDKKINKEPKNKDNKNTEKKIKGKKDEKEEKSEDKKSNKENNK